MQPRRRLRLALLAVLASLALLVAGLHTPPVQNQVLRWALSAAPDRFVVHADSLDYRLHRLWVRVEGLSVATAGHADAPFFRAAAVETDLPWSVLGGRITLGDLMLSEPVIDVRIAEDGGTNLPAGGEPYRQPLIIDRLEIRSLALRWRQPGAGLGVDVDALDARLEPGEGDRIVGPVTLAEPAEIRVADSRVPFRLDGTGAWNGLDVGLEPLRLRSEPIDAELRGEIGPVLAEPRADLALSSRIDLASLGRILGAADETAGVLELEAAVDGPVDALAGRIEGRSEELRWRDLRTGPLTLAVRIGANAIEVEELSTTVAGAALQVNGRIGLTGDSDSHLRVGWEDLDPGTVAAAFEGLPAVPVATSVDGEATLEWPGLTWRRASLNVTARARPGERGSQVTPLSGTARLAADPEDRSWSLDADFQGAGGANLEARLNGSLDLEAPMASSLTGSLTLDVAELERWHELAGRLSEGAADAPQLRGALRLQGRADGTLASPRFTGTVRGRDLSVATLSHLELESGLTWTDAGIAVRDFRLAAGANQITGSASVDPASGRLSADLDLRIVEPAPLLPALLSPPPRGLSVDGSLQGSLRLGGTIETPSARLRIRGEGLTVGRWGPGTLVGDLTLGGGSDGGDPRRLRIDEARLQTDRGMVHLEGDLDPVGGAIQGTLTAQIPTMSAWSDLITLTGLSVDLDGSLDGRVQIDGSLAEPRLDGEIRGRELRVADRGPVTLDVRLRGGRDGTTAEVALRSSGWTLGGRPLPQSTAEVTVTVRTDDPGFRVEGTLAAIHLATGRRSLSLEHPTDFVYGPRGVRIDDLELTAGESSLTVSGELGLEDSPGIEIGIDARLEHLDDLIATFVADDSRPGTPEHLAGRLEGRLRITGSLTSPRIGGTASLRDGSVKLTGLPAVTGLTLDLEGTGEEIRLRDGSGSWQGAALQLEASLPLATLRGDGGALQPARLRASVSSVTPDTLSPFLSDAVLSEIQGEAAVRIDLEAESLAPGAIRGELVIDTLDLRLAGQRVRQEVPTRIAIGGGQLTVSEWRWLQGPAGAGASRVTVTGTTGLTPESPVDLSLSGELRFQWLGAFLSGAALDGAASLDVHVDGTLQQPELSGSIQVRGGRYVQQDPRASIVELVGGIRLEGRKLVVDHTRLSAGESSFTLSGELGLQDSPGIEVEIDARLDDLDELVATFAPAAAGAAAPERLGGRVEGRVRIAGALTNPTIGGTATLREGSVKLAGLPAVTDVGVVLEGTGEALRLHEASASWQGATVHLDGVLPLAMLRAAEPVTDPARLTARITGLGPEALRPFLPDTVLSEIQGEAAARIDLEAESLVPGAIRGELVIDTLDLRLAGQTVRQEVPTRIAIDGGQLTVGEWRWLQGSAGAGASRVTVTGTTGLTAESPVDLSLGGELRFQWLSAFLSGAALDGLASLDAHIDGTLRRPVLSGSIQVQDGRYVQQDPRISISELAGEIRLEGQRLVADALQGRINGGRLMVSGDLALEDAGLPRGMVGVTVRNAALSVDQLRAETDVDLTLRLQGPQDMRLFGSVTLLRGAYRSDRPVTQEILQLLGGDAAPTGEISTLDRLRYDFRLSSAQPLRVDSPLAELGLTLDLRVVGTRARPALLGRVTLLEGGEVHLGGNTFLVESGGIDFSDPSAIDPRLDITARTQVRDEEINLVITGPAGAPRVEFTSPDSSLDEGDMLSLLVTGQTLGEVGTGNVGSLRDQALGVLASQFVGSAGRAVGLEASIDRGAPVRRFRPDPDLLSDDDDLASRLTLRKSLTSDFSLVFSQNLGDSEQRTWIGRYELPWNLTFQGVKFDDDSLSATVRHKLVLGGPDIGSSSLHQRVEAVELRGDLGIDEQELRDALDVDAGDRFDFWAWQEDVERLRELYRDRDLREATVRATREAVGESTDPPRADRLRLIYEIGAGPRTRLTIRGHDLPEDVREDLLETWSESILLEFLVADMRQIVRRHLVRRGYLEATIEVSADEPGDGGRRDRPVREIVVSIEPGDRVRRREIAFEGNARIAAGRLRTALKNRDLELAAWVEPARAEAALRSVYEQAGMPGTSVRIGEPEIRGERARLTVRIDEAPVQRVGRVEIVGNRALDRAALESAVATATGGPWSYERLLSSQSAAAAAYRSHGYNDVDVDGRVAEGPDGLILTLTIDEGPRQMLREIVVEGADVTDDGVIERGLGDLAVDEPLILSEAYEARRRLFDTGVFQSVRLDIQELGPPEEGRQAMKARFVVVEEARFRIESGLEVLDEEVEGGNRDRKPGISVNFVHDNFLGKAVSLGASGRLRSDQRLARFYVSAPRLLGLPVRSTLVLSRFSERIGPTDDPFRIDRTVTQATAEQRLPFWNHWLLSYSYNFERNETFFPNADPDDPFSPQGDAIDIVRLRSSIVRDTRDDQLTATRGAFHASTIEWAAPPLGSDAKFTKYLGHQYFYWPVAEDVVLASAVRFGTAHNFGDELIAFERFRVGGSTTVRGYPQDSLGSLRTGAGRVPGGNAMLILNQEVRFPVWKWLRGVAFADAGSTFADLQDIRPAALAYSAGVGLRVDTPFVMLRLDWGVRLSGVDSPILDGDPSRTRFHFGIGHVF